MRALFLFLIFLANCADDQPYVQNIIKRASDALLIPCDPYGQNTEHTCLVFASAFLEKLTIFDASLDQHVLAPTGLPLHVKVGSATNKLARISSSDDKFPYFLALDQAVPALFAIRSFPGITEAAQKERSFTSSKAQALDFSVKPYEIAAWHDQELVVALLSFRDDKSIGFVALDAKTGLTHATIKPRIIELGEKPSHIAIDNKNKFALISDEALGVIHQINLTNIREVFNNPENLDKNIINTNIIADKIFLQERDFGAGLKNYLAILGSESKELALINIDDKKVESAVALNNYAQAAYFPDNKSQPCCGKEPNWLALADISGNLYYYVVKKQQHKLVLEAPKEPINLLAEKNLALSKLHLVSIVGGQVKFDASLKRPMTCAKNRKMFFIAYYGSDRPHSWSLADQQNEVEAQGYTCEGESWASRFGYKRE